MHYIGIDLGGMSAKCAVLIDRALYGVCRCKTDKNNTPEQTAADLAFLAEEAIAQSGIAKEQIGGIGIGSRGIIDSEKGIVESWANFGWEKVKLAKLVSEKVGLPVLHLRQARLFRGVCLCNCAYKADKKGNGVTYGQPFMATVQSGY